MVIYHQYSNFYIIYECCINYYLLQKLRDYSIACIPWNDDDDVVSNTKLTTPNASSSYAINFVIRMIAFVILFLQKER